MLHMYTDYSEEFTAGYQQAILASLKKREWRTPWMIVSPDEPYIWTDEIVSALPSSISLEETREDGWELVAEIPLSGNWREGITEWGDLADVEIFSVGVSVCKAEGRFQVWRRKD